MTVDRLLRETDSRELSEWAAYFRIEKKHQEFASMQARAQASMESSKQKLKKGRI